jgi:DNA transformation protein
MPVSGGFLELVRELLAPLGDVTVRKMFGGASLYCDGIIFALVDDDVLYLKSDDETSPRFAAEGLKPFTYEGQTGPVSMSYWRVPERLYDEADEMLDWAREAVRIAAVEARAKAAKKAARSQKTRDKKPAAKGSARRSK